MYKPHGRFELMVHFEPSEEEISEFSNFYILILVLVVKKSSIGHFSAILDSSLLPMEHWIWCVNPPQKRLHRSGGSMRIPPGELSRTWHFEDASNNRCVQVFQLLEIPTQEPPAAPRHQTRLHQRYLVKTNTEPYTSTMHQSHTFGGFKCMTVVNTADFRLCNSFQVWLP